DLQIFTLFYPDINLSIVLLVTLGLGAILGAVLLSFSFIQVRSENRLLQKKNVQLTKELENLRNISIDEIPDEGAGNDIESKGV
ncbi:MAG: LapA family protein, partial [Calditrichia bacterium]|nr:LapA family protein [Calditrichia bacterium]